MWSVFVRRIVSCTITKRRGVYDPTGLCSGSRLTCSRRASFDTCTLLLRAISIAQARTPTSLYAPPLLHKHPKGICARPIPRQRLAFARRLTERHVLCPISSRNGAAVDETRGAGVEKQ